MKTVVVKGMSCQHCVMSVTKALNAVPGVKDLQVDLKAGKATFSESAPVDLAAVKKAIVDAGFEAGAAS
ncbi:MAG: heavy metal-associated domain-containing protein [Thermodesulfobacteriota bacterium]